MVRPFDETDGSSAGPSDQHRALVPGAILPRAEAAIALSVELGRARRDLEGSVGWLSLRAIAEVDGD